MLGVVVFAMGHRQVVSTTPVIQVVPSYKADMSNIENAINTANVYAGRQESAPETPTS